jgi:hypothetical protein
MTPAALLSTLHTTGVVLTLDASTLRYKAPKGVLTPALRDALRQHKTELYDLMEEWSERAAIAEYGGGLAREDAERLAWDCLLRERQPWT